MKRWHRYMIGLVAGLAIGGGAAWYATGKAFSEGSLTQGIWSTALNYGLKNTDELTRAAVARRGLLALPKTETVYWAATRDTDGALLDGRCTYAMTGPALDSRWWSVTLYDKQGYLIDNAADIWSFSSASLSDAERKQGWRVTISPVRPAQGHWLPSPKDQNFELTLRLYNPGPSFIKNPAQAALPSLTKESCA